jgi:hypothetical protein
LKKNEYASVKIEDADSEAKATGLRKTKTGVETMPVTAKGQGNTFQKQQTDVESAQKRQERR